MGGGSGVDGFGAEIRRAGSRALPNPRPKVLPAGPFGALLELSSLSDVQRCFAWVERWRARRPGVLVDVVPAERTLMVIATFDDAGQRGLRGFVAAAGGGGWAALGGAGGAAAGGVRVGGTSGGVGGGGSGG